ncbi:hypothetical protein EBU71_13220 [bacterium]|nr:hypothetical protein [Candidatus Elulimicrobium humile]
MKKLISHRGNLSKIIPEKENHPDYIEDALHRGYDVEVDIRFRDGEFYLGHDQPDYKIEVSWIREKSERLWIHCKDLSSASQLRLLKSSMPELKYFCHNVDPYTLVSNGFIWVHYDTFINNPDVGLDQNCIIPLLTLEHVRDYSDLDVYGICSDFIIQTQERLI